MSFSNKWTKPQNELNNVGMKLLENIKPPSPLKPRIEEAQKRLSSQIAEIRKHVHENGRKRSNDF